MGTNSISAEGLWRLRVKAKLTRPEMATHLEVDESTIFRWETKVHRIGKIYRDAFIAKCNEEIAKQEAGA